MLSKLKNLKLSKITIISISILISLALCFGFFYAALINQEKQKMEVSVLEISPYTEEVSISGKEITQNYAVTTINGKKYINNLNTVKLLLKGTDENYSGNSLTASNIVVKVGGSVVTPKTKTLGSAQNITNGVQYELTLAGIPGNGVLTVEVDANTLTDKSQNKNILTKFDSKIEVDNTAPTIAASDITYGDTLQITLSDSSSLVNKWAITSSNVLPTKGWNEITQTQKQTVTKTGLTVGTYYIWAKDSVENVSSKSIKVTGKSIDNSSISVALNPTTYTYDGTEKKPGVTVKDGTNTLTVGTDYSFVYSNNINAGTGKVTITGKGNYTGTKIVNFTINKRTLTVKAEAKSKTYGAGDPELTYTCSNQVSEQTPKFSGTLSRDAGENVGTYEIKQNTLALADNSPFLANNYTIAYIGANLTINKAATATAAAADKTYNGESQTGVTGNYVSWGGITAGIDAGSYTATATPDENHAWSDGTTAAKSITWTMSAKEVAVTWGTTIFTYNGSAQGPTASAESGVTGETINITRTTGTNAGSYTSTASISSVAGGRAKTENYKLTGAAKAFTINKANLTLTFSENSGSVSYQNGTGLFTVTPSGYVDSETGTLSVTSENTDYITVTSENAATAKNNTAVTVGYKANQYTSSKINIIVSIAATTNYNGVSKNYEITISDSIAPTIRVSSNTTYAKSQNVTITLSDEGSGLAAGTYGITYVGIPATNGSITFKSLSIIVSTSGIKSASTSVTVSDGTGIYDGTAIVQSIVNDVSGNSLAAGTSVTGEQYLDNTAPELSDFKYAISTSKPTQWQAASYKIRFNITEDHSGVAGFFVTGDMSTSLSSTSSNWISYTSKTIDITISYGPTMRIWLKDNAGNVSYKNFSLSPVAVSTETDCYVLYPTLQSAIGTASSNSDLRKWNSFWNSYIIKKC